MGKKSLILVFTIAFLAGSLVTGSIAFGEDGLTKLQKKCAKEPNNPQKIKPECELLALINAIPAQESQVYEVSAVSVIPAINSPDVKGNPVQLRCLDGDRFLDDDNNVVLSTGDLSVDNLDITARGIFIQEFETSVQSSFLETIGWDGSANRGRVFGGGIGPAIEITVTITILCLSPSP